MSRYIVPSRLIALALFAAFVLCLSARAEESTSPRVVDLKAPDGTSLKGTYFSAGKPGPGVLLLHQCNRQRKVWDDLATRLAAAGFHVMTVDLRGYGDSSGMPVDKLSPEELRVVFSEKMPTDVETAYQYLVSQPGVSRDTIAAGGASCGVNQSVHVAANHPEVKALVLLSEGTDANGRQFLRTSAKMPLFMAVADDDPDLGVTEIMQWLFTLSSNPVNKFVRYSTGGHGVEMFDAHRELPGMIVAWVATTLKKGPAIVPRASVPVSAETNFFELIDHPGGVEKAVQKFAEARKRDPKTVLFSEAVMNRLGYEHLQAGDSKGAVELMKLNTTAYPHSPNVYDSLSDAYLADGQKDLARQNAKKALELLPSDTTDPEDRRKAIKESAEQKLKQLGDAPQ
ncbi:MAG: alpha/beta fold hydrolase [Candidatus Acidiferrum sp.]